MNATCSDRDLIFEDGTPAEWAALEAHAATCAICAEELRAWKTLSVAAEELRDYTANPAFWPRIERALAEQAARKARRAGLRRWVSFLPELSLGWQTALAGAFAVILALSTGWIYLHRSPNGGSVGDPSFLKSKALKEVESAETAYERAIDKLTAEAKPQVLDSAIGDLRAQAGLNPSNAQLRYQLLAMYQEKQHTLEEVLEARQR